MIGKAKEKPHFKENESGLHKHAKEDLVKWIENYPERFGLKDLTSIRFEEKFCESGVVLFIPDITIYNKDGLKHVYEIVHTSHLTGEKLHKMQCYFFENKINPIIFEIDAYYIESKVECPGKLDMIRFGMFDDGQPF